MIIFSDIYVFVTSCTYRDSIRPTKHRRRQVRLEKDEIDVTAEEKKKYLRQRNSRAKMQALQKHQALLYMAV